MSIATTLRHLNFIYYCNRVFAVAVTEKEFTQGSLLLSSRQCLQENIMCVTRNITDLREKLDRSRVRETTELLFDIRLSSNILLAISRATAETFIETFFLTGEEFH